ncbi:MAG TPA: DUF1223 domain-containing protein [Terriglobales bacterium]|jgi:hypothetical protein
MFQKTAVGIVLVLQWLAISPLQVSAQQPVVVELFTSEGCSSCPPADALLTELSRQRMAGNAELILLGEHVEYWNSQSWTDRFSSSVFTQRQNDYVQQLHLATAYTPQIVIDGHLQGVGNNVAAVRRMIAEASNDPKPAAVSLRLLSPEKLQVTIQDPTPGRQGVLLAITEDDLTTNVRGGENGGRVLKHSAVVRSLRSLGSTSNGKFEATVNLPAKSDWKKASLRVVVLVQNRSSGLILGSSSIAYPPQSVSSAGR